MFNRYIDHLQRCVADPFVDGFLINDKLAVIIVLIDGDAAVILIDHEQDIIRQLIAIRCAYLMKNVIRIYVHRYGLRIVEPSGEALRSVCCIPLGHHIACGLLNDLQLRALDILACRVELSHLQFGYLVGYAGSCHKVVLAKCIVTARFYHTEG